MSKENVFRFFSKAASDRQLKAELQTVSTQDELVDVASEAGYEFSSEHVDKAIGEMKKQPGFFGALAEAALHIFSASEDDYPKTGVQPFGGEPNPHP